MPLSHGALGKPCAPSRAAANALLIFLLRDRCPEFTVESVIGFLAGDFQLPMCEIFGGVAAIAAALKREKVFGWPVIPALKNPVPLTSPSKRHSL